MSGGVSSTISGDLIGHVRLQYKLTLDNFANGTFKREGINGYSPHAYPAYICSVAAVEAFLNEVFLSKQAVWGNRDNPLWKLPPEVIEKMELRQKLQIIPDFLFGATFKKGEQPYQDMRQLIAIRNDIIHYKMKNESPNYISDLEQRGYLLVSPHSKEGSDYPWMEKLACAEGVRWAHNAACATVQALVGFVTPDLEGVYMTSMARNFEPITKEMVVGSLGTV